MSGTENWNETWRDTGFEGEIGRDGGISEPSTGPSIIACVVNIVNLGIDIYSDGKVYDLPYFRGVSE